MDVQGPREPTRFYTGRLRTEFQTLTRLYAIFDRKGALFIYLPEKMAPLTHIYLLGVSSNFESPFPALFYTSTREMPTLLYNSSLKRYPLRAGPPRIVHYRESPRGIQSVKDRKRLMEHEFPFGAFQQGKWEYLECFLFVWKTR